LKETYPDRKIVIVDTLAASAGSGLMVYLAVEKRNAGVSLEEMPSILNRLRPTTAFGSLLMIWNI